MKYEPYIDREKLGQVVFSAYGVEVTNISFIPLGFSAACFRLDSGSLSYFLKIWFSRQAPLRSLRLSRALYDRGVYSCVSYPLQTVNGELYAGFDGGVFALFSWIEGVSPPDVWPATLQEAWVETLATIHRSTPQLTDVLPQRERFSLSFASDLKVSLERLGNLPSNSRPSLLTLRDWVLDRQNELMGQCKKLEKLRKNIMELKECFVLCHTDMGGDNLLLGDGGKLFVLDWDEAMVAPPEHDLHEALWIGLEPIIKSYQVKFPNLTLQIDHFAFYILRRALGDMTARLVNALTTSTTAQEDEDLLFGIKEWGVLSLNGLR